MSRWRSGSLDFSAANSFDLGTTASRHMEDSGGWTTLTAAFSWQNVFDNTYQYAGRKLGMERLLRTGFTMTTAYGTNSDQIEPLAFTLAYNRVFHVGTDTSRDTDHVGVEALVLHALALRYGYSTTYPDGLTSWGVGVLLDGRRLGLFTAEVNVGGMKYGSYPIAGEKRAWGARLQYSF